MKLLLLIPAFILGFVNASVSQLIPGTPAKNSNPITKTRILQVDSAVTTKHQVTIKGKVVPYTATAGTMPIWDDEGRPIAGVFYTYYERDDVTDRTTRPLVISLMEARGHLRYGWKLVIQAPGY